MPVLPNGAETLVAPEALVDERGRLRRIDPATEGKELLIKLLEPTGIFSTGHNRLPDNLERRVAYETMALPSDIRFARRNIHPAGIERFSESRRLVPWEDIRKCFGALLILDEKARGGVSVLCTREPLRRWGMCFGFLPSENVQSGDLELDEDSYVFLNQKLEEVSPRAFIGENGSLERGWRYRSLLQAMYLMLFLDLTGGTTIKKCQSQGCPDYFRTGSQSKSKYCSKRCANRASTRMQRGQEP